MARRNIEVDIKVETVKTRRKSDYVANLIVDHISYKGWGMTPETAVMDAFAVWRVTEKRQIDKTIRKG